MDVAAGSSGLSGTGTTSMAIGPVDADAGSTAGRQTDHTVAIVTMARADHTHMAGRRPTRTEVVKGSTVETRLRITTAQTRCTMGGIPFLSERPLSSLNTQPLIGATVSSLQVGDLGWNVTCYRHRCDCRTPPPTRH